MRPIFQPRLVNGPFADPALFVDVLFAPPGFIEQVHHRLASYTWNLVENYSVDLAVTACEVSADGSRMSMATFNSRERFLRRDGAAGELHDGLLLDEPVLQVRCAVLDHGIPCLGFALQEATHVNIWPNRLAELGLAPGAWLRDAKRAIIAGAPDETRVTARWREGATMRDESLSLGALRQAAVQCEPGQKIAYVSDVAYHAGNEQRITRLVVDADLLFIEATFLERDADEAHRKRHLTARQAGSIARDSGAREIVPFHYSPRYADCESALENEARAAFRGVTV